MALMTATGPPPNFLMPLVTGFPLVVALAALPRDAPPLGPRGPALGLGLVCGLAVWNSSLAIPAFAGMAAGLALAGLRPRLSSTLAFASGLAARRGAAPRRAGDRRVGREGGDGVERGDRASAPVAVGAGPAGPRPRAAGPRRPAGAPRRGREGAGRAPAGRSRRPARGRASSSPSSRAAARVARCPLLGWAGALAGAFWLSRRTGPDELRYLYGLNAPVLALAGVGLAALWAWRRPAAVAAGLALLVPWGYGERVLAETLARPGSRRARVGGAVPASRPSPRCGRRRAQRLREPAVRRPHHARDAAAR